MSNSGKPFFVFWSLLVVPTLTILISNMGDTVVQWVKDVTIWLGEVTVLPSDESSMLDRLRYGIYRSIFGKQAARKKRDQKQSTKARDSDSEDGPYLEEPPGRILGRGVFRRRKKANKDANERLAQDFEKSEAVDEEAAREHGDKIAEDEHHYRRLLLSEIRQGNHDSAASQPKHYSYAEWSYYIKLLGQDEGDSKYHRQPHAADDLPGSHSNHHDQNTGEPDNNQRGEMQGQSLSNSSQAASPQGASMRWSWIGQRSPLMGDKDEPNWLLEKMFQKLEESLQKRWTGEPRQDEHSSAPQGSAPQSPARGPPLDRESSRSGADADQSSKDRKTL